MNPITPSPLCPNTASHPVDHTCGITVKNFDGRTVSPSTGKKHIADAKELGENTDQSPFVKLPYDEKLKIYKLLDVKSLLNLSMTSTEFNENVTDTLIKESSQFLDSYPGYKKQWDLIAKGLNDSQIKAWVEAFSNDPNISHSLVDKKDHKQFPALLFYTLSHFINTSSDIKIQEKACIDHDDQAWSATFSPDGQYVVTGSRDKTAKIMSLSNGAEQGYIKHDDKVHTVTFSPDSQYVVTGSYDNKITLSHRNTSGIWEKQGSFPHSAEAYPAMFSSDSQYLVTLSDKKTVTILGLNDSGQWSKQKSFTFNSEVSSLSFSPEGMHIVIASGDKRGQILNLDDCGQWIKAMDIDDSVAVFIPNGQQVVTASDNKKLKILTPNPSGTWINEACLDHEHSGNPPIGSPNESSIDMNPSHIDHSIQLNTAMCSPNGQHIMTVGDDNRIKIWGKSYKNNGSLDWKVQACFAHKNKINSVMFSPDGQYIVTASNDKTAKIIALDHNSHTWSEKSVLNYGDSVVSATFSPYGRLVMLSSFSSNTVEIWGPNDSGEWVQKNAIPHGDSVISEEFSPDGLHIVTASVDNTAKIWMLRGRPPIDEMATQQLAPELSACSIQ